MNSTADPAVKNTSLAEIAKVFLKLGCVSFGGPAVHIAMREEEVVRKRQWTTHEHFLDLIGATNLIPGPNSTEMTMHIGHERAGWKGLLVAGCCFILPAVIITGIFAWAYQSYGRLPEVQPFIYGIKPAIIAVIVALMIRLAKKAVKTVQSAVLGLAAIACVWLGLNDIYVLFGAGLVAMLIHWLRQQRAGLNTILPLAALGVGDINRSLPYWKVFLLFLKTGAILYGSGYVLFAFLDTDLVQTGILSRQQLVDAIAVGQFTPGPVFSSATFIGWQIGGPAGAIAATIGIFLPSFLFVGLLNPLIPLLRRSAYMSAFLDTVNVVSIAIILVVCVQMGQESVFDWRTVFIAIVGFIVAFSFKKLNTAWIVLGGAVLGWGLSLV
jgi:chromate transporter